MLQHMQPLDSASTSPMHYVFDNRMGNPPLSIWGWMQSMDEVFWTEDR